MKPTPIARGDLVRIREASGGFAAGSEGTVMEILRKTKFYDRRARVRLSAAYQPTLRLELLERVEGR